MLATALWLEGVLPCMFTYIQVCVCIVRVCKCEAHTVRCLIQFDSGLLLGSTWLPWNLTTGKRMPTHEPLYYASFMQRFNQMRVLNEDVEPNLDMILNRGHILSLCRMNHCTNKLSVYGGFIFICLKLEISPCSLNSSTVDGSAHSKYPHRFDLIQHPTDASA